VDGMEGGAASSRKCPEAIKRSMAARCGLPSTGVGLVGKEPTGAPAALAMALYARRTSAMSG